MSLLAMSTDLNDRDLAGRKRSHGDFLNQESCGAAAFRDTKTIQTDLSLSDSKSPRLPLDLE
jgi:chromatin assembly factor 1 subunit A